MDDKALVTDNWLVLAPIDYTSVCVLMENDGSCGISCGGNEGLCWCDHLCTAFEDCCRYESCTCSPQAVCKTKAYLRDVQATLRKLHRSLPACATLFLWSMNNAYGFTGITPMSAPASPMVLATRNAAAPQARAGATPNVSS